MSKTKCLRYAVYLEAKVAIEAIRGKHTLSELATRYDLHPKMITRWKHQTIENMAETFSSKVERAAYNNEGQTKKLYAKISELTVERDLLAKAFGR